MEYAFNPIVFLDLVSVVVSVVVFSFTHDTQQGFKGLFKSAFRIFYLVATLSLAIGILELLGFIYPEATLSNILLHVMMFLNLMGILYGMNRLRREEPLKEILAKIKEKK